MNEIILSDKRAGLLAEIKELRIRLATLIQTKEQLEYYICPELEARWAEETGDIRNRIKCQQLSVLELKRRIEIMRAALNREKTISEEKVNEQVDGEFRRYKSRAEEAHRRSENAREAQRRRHSERRRYRDQWNRRYSGRYGGYYESGLEGDEYFEDDHDGCYGRNENGGNRRSGYFRNRNERRRGSEDFRSGNSNGRYGSYSERADGYKDKNEHKPLTAKSLFRKIVKILHPDVDPRRTERDKELFNKASSAYHEGDVVTLQEIYDEVMMGKPAAGADYDDLSDKELISLRDRLRKKADDLSDEIRKIRSEKPYTYKEILDDPEALKKLKIDLDIEFRENEIELKRLRNILADVEEEMKELRG